MLGYIISDKNKINVKNYEIQSFNILRKTNLNIFVIEKKKVLYKNNIVDFACINGHIQVLEWFKNSGYEFKCTESAINYASKNGHIQVLEWFKNSGYEFKYDENAINGASRNGHIQVLEWFKNSGFEFKYTEEAFNNASRNGCIQVLEWFKNSEYKIKYSRGIIWWTAWYNHTEILKFYSNNINIQKLIKWTTKIIFNKTIKIKTHNKYLKGYQKN